MSHIPRYLILINILSYISADTYIVRVGTEQHVNVIDNHFLSFTVDPKYLFSNNEKYRSKECLCMASALTPAYIRIAGPSTAHMTFQNNTIAIEDIDEPSKLQLTPVHTKRSPEYGPLEVHHRQWKTFVKWAKKTGFDLVFALNNEEKVDSGYWDPNTALKILTVADKADVGDMFWQLGYECNNQSIEEYLNDLETLRVIIESFPSEAAQGWKVVGGDISNCLQEYSKSDFKDYITLSSDMMDAVLLNGNSSSHELSRMSDTDRLKLLKLLSHSTTPLWITESIPTAYNELERAADWMSSLGYSARNGFSVHFRELMEQEMYEPTLSFYMALLFKNLVGERVLNVDINSDNLIFFAHCTSLRHKAVPGAVTLYAANMDDEPARFSLKLSKREEGGDIMQFILGHDHSGNIVVNGRAMFYEGDIRPVVKRVRPYKTLLINLPAKSFGFWVLANTNVEACQNTDNKNKDTKLVEAVPVTDINEYDIEVFNHTRRRRSIDAAADANASTQDKLNVELQNRIDNFNKELKNAHKLFEAKYRHKLHHKLEDNSKEREFSKRKHRKGLKHKNIRRKLFDEPPKYKLRFLEKLFNTKRNLTRNKIDKGSKVLKSVKSHKKYHKNDKTKKLKQETDHETIIAAKSEEILKRTRRSVDDGDKDVKIDTENKKSKHSWADELDIDNLDKNKLKKILKEIQENLDEVMEHSNDYNDIDDDEIIVKTKLTDDSAMFDIRDRSERGLLKSTFDSFISVFGEFNRNVNKVWNAITLLE